MIARPVQAKTRFVCLAFVILMMVGSLPFVAAAPTPDGEDRNSDESFVARIETFSTDESTYAPGETVNATVTVERGPDTTTAVWVFDLELVVSDWNGTTVHLDNTSVQLNVGGAQVTFYFEFTLADAGEYLLNASLYWYGRLVDGRDLEITVGRDQYNKAPVVVIDPVNQTVELGAEATFDGGRSYDPENGPTTFSWDLGDGTTADGATVTHVYRAAGTYTVTLTVTDEHGASGSASAEVVVVDRTLPPGDAQVTITTLYTDRSTYEVGDAMDVSVAVTRGTDMLTSVWEGTLVLKLLDAEMVLLGSWEGAVYLAQGGATQDMSFSVEPAEAGPHILVATLYWMDDSFVDERRLNVTVTAVDRNQPPTAVIEPGD